VARPRCSTGGGGAADAAFGATYADELDELPEPAPVRASDPQGLLLERVAT
jgi:hypothetical protein